MNQLAPGLLNKPEALDTAPELCYCPMHTIHRCFAHSQQAILVRHLHAGELTLHSVFPSPVHLELHPAPIHGHQLTAFPGQLCCEDRLISMSVCSIFLLVFIAFSLLYCLFFVLLCALSACSVTWQGDAMYTSPPEPPLVFCTALITL